MTSKRSRVCVMVSSVCHNVGDRGFTLVEMMIATAIGGIVMAAVMTAFLSQHRTYLAQDDVVEMQQNARVAMDMLVRDIRSVGYDPNKLGAGITVAGANNLIFTREDDLATNGLETISYSLFDAFASTTPPSNDGLVDDLALEITTAAGTSGGRQVVAENISRLEFRYLDDAGVPTTVVGDIRSIQVSILVQTSRADTNGPSVQTYTTPSGIGWTSTAGVRSRYLTTTVKCRNLGL